MIPDITIIEGDFEISKFMGYPYKSIDNPVFKATKKHGKAHNYSKDWRLLMPVIERIESIGYDTGICRVYINGEDLSEIIISPIEKSGKIEIHIRRKLPKIIATWQAVVQFIQYYNSISQTNINTEQ